MAKLKIESKQELERLHKYIAKCGICSRRKAEELILEGRVQVNGDVITELGTKIKPDDKIMVDGTPVQAQKLYYVVMNKPKGVLTTMSDPQNRPTIVKYLPAVGAILKPVGRLDKDTEGLHTIPVQRYCWKFNFSFKFPIRNLKLVAFLTGLFEIFFKSFSFQDHFMLLLLNENF